MSYSCKEHGWRHMLNPCPSCQVTVTSGSATMLTTPSFSTQAQPSRAEEKDKLTQLEAEVRASVAMTSDADRNGWGSKPCGPLEEEKDKLTLEEGARRYAAERCAEMDPLTREECEADALWGLQNAPDYQALQDEKILSEFRAEKNAQYIKTIDALKAELRHERRQLEAKTALLNSCEAELSAAKEREGKLREALEKIEKLGKRLDFPQTAEHRASLVNALNEEVFQALLPPGTEGEK